jgi:hypothetical protein
VASDAGPGSACDFFPRKIVFFSQPKDRKQAIYGEKIPIAALFVLFSTDLWEWTSQEEMKPAN